jgi:hypothetical protein
MVQSWLVLGNKYHSFEVQHKIETEIHEVRNRKNSKVKP